MLVEVDIEKVVMLHGIPSSIVYDRDMRFTSRLWGSLKEVIGTKMKLNYAYHPKMDA